PPKSNRNSRKMRARHRVGMKSPMMRPQRRLRYSARRWGHAMRLEDFAKALAEQARKDVSAAVEAATKALGERITSLSDEAADLRAENAALSKSLEAVSARLAEAEAKAGEVADVRERI